MDGDFPRMGGGVITMAMRGLLGFGSKKRSVESGLWVGGEEEGWLVG